jgi:hypothetical protein
VRYKEFEKRFPTPKPQELEMEDLDQEGSSLSSKEIYVVLRDPDGVALFRKFIKNIYAQEELDFWIETETFRSVCKQSPQSSKERAVAIYEKYPET